MHLLKLVDRQTQPANSPDHRKRFKGEMKNEKRVEKHIN
jgi:hypothetical protein